MRSAAYLLDTHAVLWMASRPDKLSELAKQAILDHRYDKYVSVASAWEVAIKLSLGKLELSGGVKEFFRICSSNGLAILNIEKAHLQLVETLPFIHRDPFDRLLIATATRENLTLISADSHVNQYAVPCLW
ncbi:type II toxin-antitoxin system VapC family toxin [Alkanindiges sp. WGS2144]|uniref:type II toxin-antitoxin system VapC family toxin n=1 Tax=Alkanindiges sp. WGS2144 TaxID=3366808 RepID=UPI003752D92B